MTVEETLEDLIRYDLLTDLSLTRASTPFMKQLLLRSSSAQLPVWPHLTRLKLEEIYSLYDAELVAFIKVHSQLRSLVLIAVDLTDATLDAIVAHLTHVITYVNLPRNRGFTSDSLRRMVRQCRQLTHVSLYGCEQTTVGFPEAGTLCAEAMVRNAALGQHEWYLHQLDQNAINAIRLVQTTF